MGLLNIAHPKDRRVKRESEGEVDLLPSSCTTVNVDVKYSRHYVLLSVGSNSKLPLPPQHYKQGPI